MKEITLYTETDGIPAVFLEKMLVIHPPKHFSFITQKEKADYFLLPIFWEVMYEYSKQEYENRGVDYSCKEELIKKSKNLISESEKLNKPILIFFFRDPDYKIPVKNAIVFRTSLYKSKQTDVEFALPAFHKDLGQGINLFDEKRLAKSQLPNIGFIGAAMNRDVSFGQKLVKTFLYLRDKEAAKYNKYRAAYYQLRSKVLNLLESSNEVNTDFNIVNGFWHKSKENKEKLQQEYIKNILRNDYSIIVRGRGNYTYRFYETLCLGRIPVVVNTDSVFPYDYFIDYKAHCVWIEEEEVSDIVRKIVEFHSSFSSKELLDLKKKNRALWDQCLSRKGFFDQLYRHFEEN